MIAEVDCTERPVMRATSIFESGPNLRTSDRSRRSLYARTPAWSAPLATARCVRAKVAVLVTRGRVGTMF